MLEKDEQYLEKYWPIYRELMKKHCGFVLEDLMDIYGLEPEHKEAVRKRFEGLRLMRLTDRQAFEQFTGGIYHPGWNTIDTYPFSGIHYKVKVDEYEKYRGKRDEKDLLEMFGDLHTTHEISHFLRDSLKKHLGLKELDDDASDEFFAVFSELMLGGSGKRDLRVSTKEGMKNLEKRVKKWEKLVNKLDSIEAKIESGKKLDYFDRKNLEKAKAYLWFLDKLDSPDPETILKAIREVRAYHPYTPKEIERIKAQVGKSALDRKEYREGQNLAIRIHNAGLKEEFLKAYPGIMTWEHEEVVKAVKSFLRRKAPKRAARYAGEKIKKAFKK